MSTILPFNLDDLLHCRGVESERVELKASWDPVATGPQVLWAEYRERVKWRIIRGIY